MEWGSLWFNKVRPVLTVRSFESLRTNGAEGMTGLGTFTLSLSKGKLNTNCNVYSILVITPPNPLPLRGRGGWG
jgi:hypothetical protein